MDEHEAFLRFLLTPSDNPNCLGALGQYEIHSILGIGAMGLVLKSWDTNLHRMVAIKVLSGRFSADPLARKRFLREARAAAAVSHQHVVSIHAVDEDKVPFIVMELIVGRPLDEAIAATGPFKINEILRIGGQIAQGLAAAHEQGVIHRDIKPANILLENSVERVKITDFGLARVVNDDLMLSHEGSVSGTPPYMSPEQAKGERLDQRSDLFSLGSVLYAMCTGHAPFAGENLMAVIQQVINHAPRPIEECNPEIPAWMRQIVAKLLEKRPQDRFQSAAEVAALLESNLRRIQLSSTIDAFPLADSVQSSQHKQRGDSTFSRLRPLLRQRSVLIAAGIVGVSLCLISLRLVNFVTPDASGAFSSTPGTISRVVDDTDRDYAETQKENLPDYEGWKPGTDITLRDSAFNRSYRFNSAGAMTARWNFPGLPPGEYDMLLTWPAGSQFNSLASYTIYDGTRKINRHQVDLGKAPSNSPRAERYQGVDWIWLDTIRIESGTAVVELDSRISGSSPVVCDAVWLRTRQSTRTLRESTARR